MRMNLDFPRMIEGLGWSLLPLLRVYQGLGIFHFSTFFLCPWASTLVITPQGPNTDTGAAGPGPATAAAAVAPATMQGAMQGAVTQRK